MLNRLLLALLCCGPLLVNAGEKVIIYGDEYYPPYSYYENSVNKGIYVEFIQAAARKLSPEYDIEIQLVPWKRGLDYLKSGYGIALFPPYQRRERSYMEPYSMPIYKETIVLFCNEATMKSPRNKFPEDFIGLRIGVNAGFVQSYPLVAAARNGIVQMEEAKTNEANILKLQTERIDCFASDRLAAQFSAKGLNALGNSIQLHETIKLATEDVFVGYSLYNKSKYKADFIRKLNASIADLIEKGEIKTIMQKSEID